MGAYVTLQEYNNQEGMIQASELSRRRIRSMNRVIRVGKTEYVVVLRVDKDKGHIDLSKRRATPEEAAEAESRYNMSKQVHSILARVAYVCNMQLLELYETFAWDLYKRYKHAYHAFTLIVNSDETPLDRYNLPSNIRSTLISIIKHRLTPQPNLIRATITATCFGYEGIDAIKKALLAGQSCGTEESPIKIRLLATPSYTISLTSQNQEQGIKLVEHTIEEIKNVLKKYDGNVVIKESPKVVSDDDERQMKVKMRALMQDSMDEDEEE